MPQYDYECRGCKSVFERSVPYAERDKPCRCPGCKKSLTRVWLHAPMTKGDDEDFSNENSGRGRYNPQTQMYHRSVREVIDEAKKRGWNHSRG